MNDFFWGFLRSLAPFSEIELDNAKVFFKIIILQKNDFFVKAGHFSDRIAFVQSGLLRSYYTTKEKEIIGITVFPIFVPVN